MVNITRATIWCPLYVKTFLEKYEYVVNTLDHALIYIIQKDVNRIIHYLLNWKDTSGQ